VLRVEARLRIRETMLRRLSSRAFCFGRALIQRIPKPQILRNARNDKAYRFAGSCPSDQQSLRLIPIQ
jgi:hypothetical protein